MMLSSSLALKPSPSPIVCEYCFKISLALVNSSSVIRSIIVKGISQLAHSGLKKARGTSYPACTHRVKKNLTANTQSVQLQGVKFLRLQS